MMPDNQDSDLESDNAVDFSQMNSRLDSFRGSNLAQEVSPERLAQAGFYFTGQADRVRCFSCRKTVENWCREDKPEERHEEISPSCRFLSCIHHAKCKSLINGSTFNDEAVDMEYRLRTGEVVDEPTYPLVPHMRSEEARLRTFTSWPSNAPVRPRELAQAGLFYLGRSDRVQCFCCSGMLNGWEEGDDAWDEHSRHFSKCFFILGHDVGNIPFEGSLEEDEGGRRQNTNIRVPMGSFEDRLRSFDGVQLPVNHEMLARAGFYSTGKGDHVLCFRCGGGLKGWQPEEDPWEEHAKNYPGCSFLLAEKGQEFVNNIQLQDPHGKRPTTSHQNGFSEEKTDEDPLEKLQKLQREKQCKVCMDRDICIVFIPCGHLATCKECSESLIKCPICCGAISQKIKTYIA